MGQTYSHHEIYVNANCPVCIKSGKLPNLAGRFFLINDKQCKCNGCHTIFDKNKFYSKFGDI